MLTRPNKVETAVHGCNCWLSVGLYHVVVPLSFLRSISLASLFLFFLFLADQIFYRSYVNRQHFRLRSFASLCYTLQLATRSHQASRTCTLCTYQLKSRPNPPPPPPTPGQGGGMWGIFMVFEGTVRPWGWGISQDLL